MLKATRILKHLIVYLNVKKERKIIREKIILELLFNRKVSKKFVDFDKNGKPLKTKNNIISYIKYKNGGKLYDLATKEYSFFIMEIL